MALTQVAARLDVPLWRAHQFARGSTPVAPTGWAALDAELPDGGWPLAGLTELLAEAASGELALLAPWLRSLARRSTGPRELVCVAPPATPCAAALQALGLAAPQWVFITPGSDADAAWSAEQALRSGSCAAVLWWSSALSSERPAPVATATLRRLHLAAQAGSAPLIALRPLATRTVSSPAPLRLACTPLEGRQLAVEVFKRRGPPMSAPLSIALPWPGSVRSAIKSAARPSNPSNAAPPAAAHPPTALPPKPHDVVDRPAPAAPAAASPALVTGRG